MPWPAETRPESENGERAIAHGSRSSSPSTTPPAHEHTPPPMATLAERKKMLYDDPDLSVVEAHRVFCIRCEKWLKLDEVKLYAASVWRCHKNTKSHNARPPVDKATLPAHTALPPSGHPHSHAHIHTKSKDSDKNPRLPSGPRTAHPPAYHTSASAPVPHPARALPRLKLKMPSSTLKQKDAHKDKDKDKEKGHAATLPMDVDLDADVSPLSAITNPSPS
ncbi:hypothetical protein K439DRAFT_252343, partial [Ramaria rubella]